MRFSELRCLAGTRLVVFALLALAQFPSAQGSRGPGYGGTLRVELHDAGISLDPREWKAGAMESAADEKMGALVFDRLVGLANYGRFQPQMATERSREGGFTRG